MLLSISHTTDKPNQDKPTYTRGFKNAVINDLKELYNRGFSHIKFRAITRHELISHIQKQADYKKSDTPLTYLNYKVKRVAPYINEGYRAKVTAVGLHEWHYLDIDRPKKLSQTMALPTYDTLVAMCEAINLDFKLAPSISNTQANNNNKFRLFYKGEPTDRPDEIERILRAEIQAFKKLMSNHNIDPNCIDETTIASHMHSTKLRNAKESYNEQYYYN